MQILFNTIQALFNVEWSLPLLPVNRDTLRDSDGNLFVVVVTTPSGIVTLEGPRAPVGWLYPVNEDWIVKTFEHRLADLWATVESMDFAISGATVPNEFVPSSLSGNLVLWDRPVSFLPQERIGSVHVLVEPMPGVHGDFSGADLKGKPFDRCDLTIDPGKGRISVVENRIEIDTKGVKTSLWAGDFPHAVCDATHMAYAVLEDKQLVIEPRLGPRAE